MRLLFVLIFLCSFSLYSQIKLNPDYTYIKDGKEISYKKGLKHLQSGNYTAQILDEKRTVVIVEPGKLEEGMPFPFETVRDISGNTLNPSDMEGQVVVINYWFTGCRPCIMEMPELNEVVARYAEQDVLFLAYANDIAPMVSSFLRKHQFDYTIIPGQMTATLNKGITLFPTHILVNREGIIEFTLTGYSEGVGDKISSQIEKMLN
ncbi:MAG: TlpA disulfide reductase family protein [Cyclobacteriaceae bacterium]